MSKINFHLFLWKFGNYAKIQFVSFFLFNKKQSHNTPIAGGRGSIARTLLLDWFKWSALRSGRALPLGKWPPIPIGQETGWAPEQVWRQEPKKNPLCLRQRIEMLKSYCRLTGRRLDSLVANDRYPNRHFFRFWRGNTVNNILNTVTLQWLFAASCCRTGSVCHPPSLGKPLFTTV
jgi:hypothetical protein